MSKELTEREKELIKWITFLLDLVNAYSIFLGLVNRDIHWLEKAWGAGNIKSKQEEMVSVLKDKYNLSLDLKTNVDVIKGDND